MERSKKKNNVKSKIIQNEQQHYHQMQSHFCLLFIIICCAFVPYCIYSIYGKQQGAFLYEFWPLFAQKANTCGENASNAGNCMPCWQLHAVHGWNSSVDQYGKLCTFCARMICIQVRCSHTSDSEAPKTCWSLFSMHCINAHNVHLIKGSCLWKPRVCGR